MNSDRELVVCSLAALPSDLPAPFVALVSSADATLVEAQLVDLVARGCVEVCCVGPDADVLHETLDELLVAAGVFAVTTSFTEATEACEYFVHAAMAGRPHLVAFISADRALERALANETSGASA